MITRQAGISSLIAKLYILNSTLITPFFEVVWTIFKAFSPICP